MTLAQYVADLETGAGNGAVLIRGRNGGWADGARLSERWGDVRSLAWPAADRPDFHRPGTRTGRHALDFN